jgi:hypothetical protein
MYNTGGQEKEEEDAHSLPPLLLRHVTHNVTQHKDDTVIAHDTVIITL